MRNISFAFSINGDARFRGHDKFGDFRALPLQRFSRIPTAAILDRGVSRGPYSTPLLLGTPFTLREGATAMATARANALKMDSKQ